MSTDIDREAKLFGHWDECLRHFAEELASRAPKGSRASTQLREPMAQFCGVQVTSLPRWFKEETKPQGEVLLRLLFFLDLIGYRVSEIEEMPKYVRHFAELVVFNLLSVEEATNLVGYPNVQQLYAVFLMKRGVMREKEEKMYDAWKDRKAEVEKRIAEARKTYCQDGVPPTLVHQLVHQATTLPERNSHAVVVPRNEKAFICMVQAMQELLDERSFNEMARSDIIKHHTRSIERVAVLLSSLSSKLIFAGHSKEVMNGT